MEYVQAHGCATRVDSRRWRVPARGDWAGTPGERTRTAGLADTTDAVHGPTGRSRAARIADLISATNSRRFSAVTGGPLVGGGVPASRSAAHPAQRVAACWWTRQMAPVGSSPGESSWSGQQLPKSSARTPGVRSRGFRQTCSSAARASATSRCRTRCSAAAIPAFPQSGRIRWPRCAKAETSRLLNPPPAFVCGPRPSRASVE